MLFLINLVHWYILFDIIKIIIFDVFDYVNIKNDEYIMKLCNNIELYSIIHPIFMILNIIFNFYSITTIMSCLIFVYGKFIVQKLLRENHSQIQIYADTVVDYELRNILKLYYSIEKCYISSEYSKRVLIVLFILNLILKI